MTTFISLFFTLFLGISIISNIVKSAIAKKLNDKSIKILTDIFNSMNVNLIDVKKDTTDIKQMMELDIKSVIQIPEVVENTPSVKKEIKDYIYYLQYSVDNFIDGEEEKKLLNKVISKIKTKHGIKS